jgi:hypothetical protein
MRCNMNYWWRIIVWRQRQTTYLYVERSFAKYLDFLQVGAELFEHNLIHLE